MKQCSEQFWIGMSRKRDDVMALFGNADDSVLKLGR